MCKNDTGLVSEDNILSSRGFVTIATGDNKYYQMAENLLCSYRVNGASSLPFAIICDCECAETRNFDDIVIIDNPTNSYLDKLSLYKYTPYQETIFIDADSLILAPVHNIWEDFKCMGDFSCYGKVLPVDSKKGWFIYENLGELKDKVTFGINMHGGIYYLRKTAICREVFENASVFAQNYSAYAFAHFQDPADEPVLALAMALSKCKPCDRQDRILFLPSVDGKMRINTKGILKYDGEICEIPVLHFANDNIKRYLYQYLSLKVKREYEGTNKHLRIIDRWTLHIKSLVPEIKSLAKRLIKMILPRDAVLFLKRVIAKK